MTAEYAQQARLLLQQYGPATAYEYAIRRGGLEHYPTDLQEALRIVAHSTALSRPPEQLTHRVIEIVRELRRGMPFDTALHMIKSLDALIAEHGAQHNCLYERSMIETEAAKVRHRQSTVAAANAEDAMRAAMRGDAGRVRVDLSTGQVVKVS